MIILGQTLLSDELYEEQFVCDLSKCKGGCCVQGDAGAPLTDDETAILVEIAGDVAPFMIPEGLDAINSQGFWVKDAEGDLTTPLVDGQQCAYVFFDPQGIAKCAIERAFEEGLIDFRKPVSCHLYPVRVTKYPHYDALNYHRWPVCDPARRHGKKQKVRVFEFLKDALTRRFGAEWYEELKEYIRYSFPERK